MTKILIRFSGGLNGYLSQNGKELGYLDKERAITEARATLNANKGMITREGMKVFVHTIGNLPERVYLKK